MIEIIDYSKGLRNVKTNDCEKVYVAFGSNDNNTSHRVRFNVILPWDNFAFHGKEFWVDRVSVGSLPKITN
ncbi:MAG: hypothetical protein EBW83_04505 [Rhodobacterales bacterium]|nr:hypothetical protein [Rhodobacterales bacterium]NCW06538.1 hypothetical protein [Rhodobacterales bacterium]NCX53995.1 hypothetical protein [Rhodobacterales bacterium]NCX59576.1 hypothetical protein [Paracoccaceae bacterium]